eukprot:5606378-Pyramimonas_sp.AAC.1
MANTTELSCITRRVERAAWPRLSARRRCTRQRVAGQAGRRPLFPGGKQRGLEADLPPARQTWP